MAPARPEADNLCHLPLGLATTLHASGAASSTLAATTASVNASASAARTALGRIAGQAVAEGSSSFKGGGSSVGFVRTSPSDLVFAARMAHLLEVSKGASRM